MGRCDGRLRPVSPFDRPPGHCHILIRRAELQRTEAHTGAVTLIQRFGSATNLNIYLDCVVLDGVYRTTEGLPGFHEVRAPTAEQLQTLLARIITRLMNRMHRDVQL